MTENRTLQDEPRSQIYTAKSISGILNVKYWMVNIYIDNQNKGV